MGERNNREAASIKKTKDQPTGPRSWSNWQEKRIGKPLLGTVELCLFSDAWFIADAPNHGPYGFLNPVPHTARGIMYEWKPAIVLRVEHYENSETGNMLVTNDENYHGGWLYDEIAALACLIFGARIVAGPVDRTFEKGGDPLGRPSTYVASLLPTLPSITDSPQIPALRGTRDLRDLSKLDTFPLLKCESAIALVKSARLYQQALWLCDTSPELAWLMLVSSVEAAAGYWDTIELSAIDRLKLSYPSLVVLLDKNEDKALTGEVAEHLQNLIAATGKFVAFIIRFAPEAPAVRTKFGRFNFEQPSLKAAASKIYGYRSRALHGGIPFPHPMCYPPRTDLNDNGVAEETPLGLGSSSRGSTWTAADTPMLLHLFAYITRGALLNWWTSIFDRTAQPS